MLCHQGGHSVKVARNKYVVANPKADAAHGLLIFDACMATVKEVQA